MPEIDVLKADLTDPGHAAALVACIDDYARSRMGGEIPLEDEILASMVEGLRATPSALVWLGRAGGEFAGAVVAFAGFSTFAARPRWNVHDVAVLEDLRGQGIGRAMLQRVIADAEAAGCSAVSLEVRHDNEPARHLYASLGFGDGFAPMDFWVRPIERA